MELITYISSQKLPIEDMFGKAADKSKLLEVLEFALDLKVTQTQQDKVGDFSLTKAALFKKCKALYDGRGTDRLGALENHVVDGAIAWPVAGHYSIQTAGSDAGGARMSVTWKIAKKTVVLGPDSIGEDPGPFQLKYNYSIESAFFESPIDTYICKCFFPSGMRKLAREDSSEQKLIHAIGGSGAAGLTTPSPKFKRSSSFAFQAPVDPPLVAPAPKRQEMELEPILELDSQVPEE
jgi:hypothetical protein